MKLVSTYADEGVDLPHFAEDLIDYLRTGMLAALSAGKADESASISLAIEKLLQARRNMKTDRIPQLALELAVIELASPTRSFRQQGVASGSAAPGGTPSPVAHELATRPDESRSSNAQTAFAPSDSIPPGARVDVTEKVLATPVLSDAPTVSLHDVKRRWSEVFAKIRDVNASLPLVLQAGQVSGVKGNEVEVTFAYAFHAETINQEKNHKTLSDVISALFGTPLKVYAKHVPVEEVTSSILQEFGGSVV